MIDVALSREPFAADSERLLLAIERGEEQAAIAWHSFSNLYYVVRRNRGETAARRFVERLLRSFRVPRSGREELSFALSLPMTDFEDAMQVAAARDVGANLIVTRNVRDYANSPIPAVTPATALQMLS